jgi:hypothetical protein
VITLSTAAVIAALPIAAGASGSVSLTLGAGMSSLLLTDALRKSKLFVAASAFLTRGLNADIQMEQAFPYLKKRLQRQLAFLLKAEPKLRKLADTQEQFGWVIRALEWVRRRAEEDNDL